ncbi:MAG TPA: hypothetical protein VHB77_22600 [Planctomycetaceae bacterium]|nr:hypothetical protein [Planctomycetaceae bacterium]
MRQLFRGLLCVACVVGMAGPVSAASFRTANFLVRAATPELAQTVAEVAEEHRDLLARDWFGKPIPRWDRPCVIAANAEAPTPGGATTFSFERGQVVVWEINVHGSREQVLDSVLPHEISHAILISHFQRPLPRWADEGAATLAEDASERRRQRLRTEQILRNEHPSPLRKLLDIREYPGGDSTLTFYAQGYSVCDFLVQTGGRSGYLTFLEDAERTNWDDAVRRNYGFRDVDALERKWNAWVKAGSPDIKPPAHSIYVMAQPPPPPPLEN